MRKSSIFNNSYTIGLNIMKPSQCTSLLVKGFPIVPSMQPSVPMWFGRSETDKPKQTNKLLCLRDCEN